MADGMKIVSDKWMLQSRQIVNWGSYGGWHEFRPSMDETMPVTLLAGASESGKSTLVDAQISLLYPSGTPYNKASNSGRSERNDYTYLRGMIGVSDSENGETPIFLRGKDADGTPQNIWGAIVDTYVNKTDGGLLSCGKFLYLNAGDGQDGLRRRYITWNRTIDPRLMDQYRNTPFTRSMFEKTYPECTTHTNAAAFHASIWQDMGLSADACRLLHKIQSADAPSKLDDIFKQGVLDIPESIRLAHETVDDYNRFNENFHSMEDKMARVAILQNIQTRYGEYAKQTSERREYEPINPDSEHGNATLSAWARSRMASEVRAGLPAAQRKVKESQEAIDRAMQRVGELNTRIDAVKERIQGIDGGSLQQLGKDLQRVRQDIDEASRQRHAIAERFEQVEGRLPDSEQTWDAKRAMLAETLDTYEERLKDANARFQQLVGERHDRQRDRDSLRRDYQRKLTHRTRISDDMDDARTLIMRATGLDASELPYVAELMDVNEQDEQWRLAMNVTYAPIAQTILVDKRHEQGFAAKISAIDPKLMTRRTWRFIDTGMQYESSASEGWMSSKLQYQEDSPFAGWLKNQTTSPRFDARCVHAIDDMNHDERQVQSDGQIKSGDRGFHGSKGLHQVIGFMNEQYLAELKNQLDKAEQALQNADRRSEQMSNAISLLQDEHELARIVADMPWSKIDVNGLREQETRIRRQIERIENDPELGQLQTELKQLNQQATAENRNQYQAEDDLDKAQHAVQAEQAWLDAYGNDDFDDATLSSMVSNLLADAYENCFGASVRAQDRPKLIAGLFDHESETPFHTRALRNIARIARTRIQEIDARSNQLRADTERIMDDYLKNHSTDDNTVMASVEDYRYFLDELNELNMLVTRAATDEEYANSKKTLHELPTAQPRATHRRRKHQRTTQPHQQHAQRTTIRPTRRQTITRRDLQPNRPTIRNNPQPHPVKTGRLDAQRKRQSHGNTQRIQQLRNIREQTAQRTRQNTRHQRHQSIRRTQPRPTRTQLILRNRAPRQRPRRTHQLYRRKIRRSPPRTHLIRLRRSPHLPPRRRPHRTPHLHHALPRRSTHQSRRPLHQTRARRTTPTRLPNYRLRPGKQNRGNPQRRQQSIRRIQRPIHRQLIPTGTRQRNHHTGRNTAHHRTRETNNGGITHGNGQKHHQQRHPQPTQRIRHRLSHQAHV